MSKIGELFDSALEGYARGSNPRYAKQQDARQLARDMYGVQQAIGKTGMAGHPMESALLMMQSANPVLQQRALDSMQEYQNRKSEAIKTHEYRGMMSEEGRDEFDRAAAAGWKPIGDKFQTYHPQTKRPVEAISMINSLGETKTVFLAPAYEKPERTDIGGVPGFMNVPGVGPNAMPGWSNGQQQGVRGAQPMPQTPQGNATAAVNAPQGPTTNMGGQQTPATGAGVPPSPAAPPMISNQPVAQAAPARSNTGDPMLDMVINRQTAIADAEAATARKNEKAGQKRSDWLGIQGGRDQADQFANKAHEALQLIDKYDSTAAGYTAEEVEKMPNTPASDFHSTIDSLKSDIVLGGMKELKMASETGSTGFGQMSIPELNMLIARIEALDPSNSPEKIRQDIVEITMRMERMNWMAEVGNVMKHSNVPEWDPQTHSGGDNSLEAAAAYYGVEAPEAVSDQFMDPTVSEADKPGFIERALIGTGMDRRLSRLGLGGVSDAIANPGEVYDGVAEEWNKKPIAQKSGKEMAADAWYGINKKIEDTKKNDLVNGNISGNLQRNPGATGTDILKTFPGVGVVKDAFTPKQLPDTKAGNATRVLTTGSPAEVAKHFDTGPWKNTGVAEAIRLITSSTPQQLQVAIDTYSAPGGPTVTKPGFLEALDVLSRGNEQEIHEFFKQYSKK